MTKKQGNTPATVGDHRHGAKKTLSPGGSRTRPYAKRRESLWRSRKRSERRGAKTRRRFATDAIGLAAAFGKEVYWPELDYGYIYDQADKEARRIGVWDFSEVAHNAVNRLLSAIVTNPETYTGRDDGRAFLARCARHAVWQEVFERFATQRFRRELATGFCFRVEDDDEKERDFPCTRGVTLLCFDRDALRALEPRQRKYLAEYLRWCSVTGRVTRQAHFGENDNICICLKSFLRDQLGLPDGSCGRHARAILAAIKEGLYAIDERMPS